MGSEHCCTCRGARSERACTQHSARVRHNGVARTAASIVTMNTPNTAPSPAPITPDSTVRTPQLFITSSCCICSGVGSTSCLYTLRFFSAFAGCACKHARSSA